jgi:hypothetical protein
MCIGYANQEEFGGANPKAQHAVASMKAQSALVSSVSHNSLGSWANVENAMSGLTKVGEFLGIVGDFMSLLDLFSPDKDDQILKEIAQLDKEIESLRREMGVYFSQLSSHINWNSCKDQLSSDELKVRDAWNDLVAMHKAKGTSEFDTKKYIFM